MIEGNDRCYFIHCDQCAEAVEVEHDDVENFHHMIRTIKADGWQVVPGDGDWRHICPSCVEADRDARRSGLLL